MWIHRNATVTVERAWENFPAVVLTGARQVGKTSLVRHLLPKADYVSFDLPAEAELARLDPDGFFAKHREPLILDEIQYVPELFRHLKRKIDQDRKPGRFLLTGSQDFLLMKGVTESLAGRSAILTLPNLNVNEVSKGNGKETDAFLWRGGFPELWERSELDRDLWLGSYIATYLERDVRNLSNVGNLRDFDRFLRAAALRAGQLLSMAELARDVGVVPNTAKNWISILQASQQVFLLEPYHVNRGKRLIKSPKLYFCDTGLLVFLLGFKSMRDLMDSPLWGAVWENFVVCEIRKSYQNRGEKPPLWFWRTASGEEIDLLIDQGGGRFLGIECKTASEIPQSAWKGMDTFRAAYDKTAMPQSAVVCRTSHAYPIRKTDWCRPLVGKDGILTHLD